MHESPIGWVGGKRRLRGEILRRIPEHGLYVEVFAGAAWVLFGMDRSPSVVEILNDLNGELSNFFRCVSEKPLELMEALRWRLISQEDFLRARESVGAESGSEIDRAARFFWFLKLSFGSKYLKRAQFGYRLQAGPPRFRPELIERVIHLAHERLKHVLVFNEDCEKLIKRLDRPNAFFYCDPPYYGTRGCYRHEFTDSDHERLAGTLKGIEGGFLLSYNDSSAIRRLYSWAMIEEITTSYSIGRRRESRGTKVTELLIRNYELPATAKSGSGSRRKGNDRVRGQT